MKLINQSQMKHIFPHFPHDKCEKTRKNLSHLVEATKKKNYFLAISSTTL